MTHILVDAHNMMHRSRHVVRGDAITQAGLCMHIMLSSMADVWRRFEGRHVMVAMDARSWRRDIYPDYKRARREARIQVSAVKQQEDHDFFEIIDQFFKFLSQETNVTLLDAPGMEADDWIARWIQRHPKVSHTIISTDSDLHQLISPRVQQYDGVRKILHTHAGSFNERGEPWLVKSKPLVLDPEWLLFLKCVRGDPTDGIFSAAPGARERGSTRKVGIREAYEDRHARGYAWNQFMLQEWDKLTDQQDLEGNPIKKRVRVLDEYNRNRQLIDLTQQPPDIIATMDKHIDAAQTTPVLESVGVRFLKFCGEMDLQKAVNNSAIPRLLSSHYSHSLSNKE